MTISRKTIEEALAATVNAVNEILETYPTPSAKPFEYRIELVTDASIHLIDEKVYEQQQERKFKWEWSRLYLGYAKPPQNGWMYVLTHSSKVGSLCCGHIELDLEDNFVSIEYLERLPEATELRGLATSIADLFVATLADTLKITKVLINQPHPDLVKYYAGFGYQSHFDEGSASREVVYMIKELQP